MNVDPEIDQEISARLASFTSWRRMDMCFKWRRVVEFLRTKGVQDDEAYVRHLKDMIRRNELPKVQYDAVRGVILSLNHPEDEQCVTIDALPQLDDAS